VSLASQALLIDAFINALAQLRAALTRVLIELFTAPKSWRDADQDRFVERALPLVLGAQRAAASLTDDYLSRMIADQTGEPYQSRPVDLDKVTGAAVRNGVDPEVVYRRPHQEMWTALAEQEERTTAFEEAVKPIRKSGESVFDVLDRIEAEKAATPERRTRIELPELPDLPRPAEKPLTDAIARGERRAKLIGLTDLELAVTHTVRERLAEEPRYRYYRRVLTGAENCGLCVVASTQRYRKGDLMPIHPNCDCVVEPLPDDAPHVIDRDLLESAHQAIAETFGKAAIDARSIDYRKIITVQNHAEMGPLLAVSRHKFSKRQLRDNDLAAKGR
jgi:hypothetical protein